MIRRRDRIAVVTALLAATGLLSATSAAAAPAHRLAESGARAFWTPERMRQAPDLGVLRPASPAQLDAPALGDLAEPTAAGPAHIDPATSRPPRPPAGASRRPTAPPFITGQVPPATMTTYPYSANGRLFGVLRGGRTYSCSATVVNSASRSVALTAGHCLFDPDLGWARQIAFVPAYLDGARPFGAWSATYVVTTRGWSRGNFHGDYGAIKLSSPSGRIGDVVGEEGLAWNASREQLFQAIGYPFNRGGTELMWNCISTSAGTDPFDRSRGRPDTGIGCDMGGGSSGGGWTIRDAGGASYVNGVTSYSYKSLRNILFSPYLTGKVAKVVNQADRN